MLRIVGFLFLLNISLLFAECEKLTDYKGGFYVSNNTLYLDKYCKKGIAIFEKRSNDFYVACFKYGYTNTQSVKEVVDFVISTCPDYLKKSKREIKNTRSYDKNLGLFFVEYHRDEDTALIFLAKSMHRGNKNARLLFKYIVTRRIDKQELLSLLDYSDPTFDAFYDYISYNGKVKDRVFLDILKHVKHTGKYHIK